jgi:hypothetical protein
MTCIFLIYVVLLKNEMLILPWDEFSFWFPCKSSVLFFHPLFQCFLCVIIRCSSVICCQQWSNVWKATDLQVMTVETWKWQSSGMLHHLASQKLFNISEMRTSSIIGVMRLITLMMEAVSTSKTWSISVRPHGTLFQKTCCPHTRCHENLITHQIWKQQWNDDGKNGTLITVDWTENSSHCTISFQAPWWLLQKNSLETAVVLAGQG